MWLFFSLCLSLFSQTAEKSITELQNEYYSRFHFTEERQWDSLHLAEGNVVESPSYSPLRPQTCSLNKVVYGWHPYWNNSSNFYLDYRWDLLSHFTYFSYDVDPGTGNAVTTNNWATAASVTYALSQGVKVHLCATLFANHATFFGNATAQQTLITNLINAVQSRGAHGVNIDFEGVPVAQSAAFTAFMINLSNQMHAAIPGSEVTIALYAVDWSNLFDEAALAPYVDMFIIMGYDYYWSGSTQAGPVGPLYPFTSGGQHLSRSVNYYRNQGVPASKLVLGLPYYGREWQTASNTIPSNVTGTTSSRTFSYVKTNASGNYSAANRQWDANSFTPAYIYNNGSWNQCFIDDAYSLEKRLNLIHQRGLAGLGIWALGYDDGYSDYWNVIEKVLSDCGSVPCQDTVYDSGGPNFSYFSNESYTYTIAPSGASQVNIQFPAFSLGTGDNLKIYDGNSTSAPLIGTYSGTTNPGTINSAGNALTLQFLSDASSQGTGFSLRWQCVSDNTPPVTVVNPVSVWQTANFTATFTDSDVGSGVQRRFYSISDYDGTEWRANASNGFFNEEFSQTSLHPDWTQNGGSWSISSGYLHQSDEVSGNTGLSASLTQTAGNAFIYHWKSRISGSGTNRRAGIHIFCDNPSLPNRGNSYLIWFRADNSKIEIYDVEADVLNLVHTITPVTINVNQWYDCKVVYVPASGLIQVYLDDVFKGSWTDNTGNPPLSSGNSISFRNGNCVYDVDDFRVYKSRTTNSVPVSTGTGSQDIRYQNPAPAGFSGKIYSLIQDNVQLLSAQAQTEVKTDWTAPLAVINLNDGIGTDIDNQVDDTQLSANWTATDDPHSGLLRYEYCIGTSAGASDVVNWTDNGLATSMTHPGSFKTMSGTYYISVRAVNGAGLTSAVATSDGVTVTSVPLPVELISFTAEKVDNEVFVNWSALEISVQNYLLEKSRNGQDFLPLAEVTATNNAGVNLYTVRDTQIFYKNFYRLQMVDSNGASTNSEIIQISMEGENPIKIFPNPTETDNFIYMKFNYIPNEPVFVGLYDLSGKIIYENEALPSSHTFTLSLPQTLSSGLYYLRIQWDGNQERVKLWKR